MKTYYISIILSILIGTCGAVPSSWGECYDFLENTIALYPGCQIAYWNPSSNPCIPITGHVAILYNGYLIDAIYGRQDINAFGPIDYVFDSIEELNAFLTIDV